MFLSRMDLNPQRRGTKRFVADPQALHAAVLATFPPGGEESDGRVLWRLDSDGKELTLWVVSPERPSFEVIQEQAGWSQRRTDETRTYDVLLGRLAKGQTYAFRLTGNPVHTVTDDSGRKRRLGHVTVAQQQQWFMERADPMGIAVRIVSGSWGESPDLVVHDRRVQRFRRGPAIVTLSQATFDGTCRVEDPDRLRQALIKGVGRAKGYGCGLLTLATVLG